MTKPTRTNQLKRYIALFKKKMIDFENKLDKHIGINSDNDEHAYIHYKNEFNKQVDNVQHGIFDYSPMSKIAIKYNKIFKRYQDYTFQLKQLIGPEETMKYLDTLDIIRGFEDPFDTNGILEALKHHWIK